MASPTDTEVTAVSSEDIVSTPGLEEQAAQDQLAQAASASGAEPSGSVENISGTVIDVRADGSRFEMEAGSPAYQGDTLYGGFGDDVLFGGEGENIFVFHAQDGEDVIEDFGIGDKVLFEGSEFQVGDLDVQKHGDDTIITFGASNDVSVRLKHVDADKLRNEADGYSISGNNDGTVVITCDGTDD